MQSISTIFPKVYHFFSAIANFCGKSVIPLNSATFKVAHEQLSENARRIVFTVSFIFSLLAISYASIKYLLERVKSNPKVTLETEFASAKESLFIDRFILNEGNINLKSGTSAKVFLTIKHEGQNLTQTCIISKIDQTLTHKQLEEEVIKQIDLLFEKIKPNLEFNKESKAEFRISILLKEISISPHSTYARLTAQITVNKEKISDFSISGSSKVGFGPALDKIFCESLDIPFVPQFDAQGELI